MDLWKAERRALIWLGLTACAFLVSLSLVPFGTAPFRWLTPLGTGCTTLTWWSLWRQRRRERLLASRA